MSETYVLEPPCSGRVLLETSHGPLVIDLWRKEAPSAVRNFLQLCVDGEYNGCIFHRIIPDFIVQTGDPTGTGLGGKSIYPEGVGFPVELHPRLKFRYRGLVGLASSCTKGTARADAEKTHGSQFFITLNRADSLNGLHTIFGKIQGNSVYNLARIAECEVDKSDRPVPPEPKILKAEIVLNPFDEEFAPRPGSKALVQLEKARTEVAADDVKVDRPILTTKKEALLSFAEDEEEEEAFPASTEREEPNVVDEKKSPEDAEEEELPESAEREESNAEKVDGERKEQALNALKDRIRTIAEAKPSRNETEEENEDSPTDEEKEDKEATGIDLKDKQNRNKTKRALRSELRLIRGHGTVARQELHKAAVEDADLVNAFVANRRFNVERNKRARGSDNEVLHRLAKFTERVKAEGGEGDWFGGEGLKFPVDATRAFEFDAAKDALITIDEAREREAEVLKERRRQQLLPSLRGDKRDKW